MEWTSIDTLPDKPGFYECYFPESAAYKENHSEVWFDGTNFRSGDSWTFLWNDVRFLGSPINKYISHWMKIERPQ